MYLVFIPLPDASEVLSSHSEMDVAEEMRERKEEHRVTSVNGDELDHIRCFEVLVVPFIKVFIAIVNEHNFFSIQVIFILRFWWVQSVPQLLVQVVDIVIGEKRGKSNQEHVWGSVLAEGYCHDQLCPDGQNVKDTQESKE